MRIAIVGAGVSGLVAAELLHRDHEITVYEAADHVGGHANTVEVDDEGSPLAVDTGFIVFNDRNYPNFRRLLDRLGVASQPSEMSFSVRDDRDGLEYRGSSLDTLFAQRRNLVRPRFLRMVGEIVRFYREAPGLATGAGPGPTLGEVLGRGGYSRTFVDQHLLPMAAAVWSTGTGPIRDMPARTFVEFFHNHGMLSLRGRPRWRTVRGGSREYVRALTAGFRDRIRTRTPVASVRRGERAVTVVPLGGEPERHDRVILACHSDQALRLLADPTPAEREILGAIPYTPNDTVLHTDTTILPRRRKAWSSWNVHLRPGGGERIEMTYYMNRLQDLRARRDYCVTLNRTDTRDPAAVLRRFDYHHPAFTREAVAAQRRHGEIEGVRGTHYCGAYWGYGFHEDGVVSGIRTAERLGARP